MMDVKEIGPYDMTASGQMSHVADGDRLRRLLTLMTDDEVGHIRPSKVAQKHIVHLLMENIPSPRPWICSVLQPVWDSVTPLSKRQLNRKVKKFRKSAYDLISTEVRATLRQIRVTEEMYRSSFKLSTSTSLVTVPSDSRSSSLSLEDSLVE